MPRQLIQYDSYSRQEVHDTFDPDTQFTTHGGPWGMWGIVKCPNTIKDYVLFVTIGSSQGNYDFVEDIYDNGTMTSDI